MLTTRRDHSKGSYLNSNMSANAKPFFKTVSGKESWEKLRSFSNNITGDKSHAGVPFKKN
jgi:hypothetical protein